MLVSTPIGNLADMSARALDALRTADQVLCEDTRHTARLLEHHGVRARTTPLHDHNEAERVPALIEALRRGERIALVSDAGTPVVSDPGFRLVRAAAAAGLTVTAVPGPNAAVTALVLSGLPPAPFLFAGFAPPRQSARIASYRALRGAEAAGLSATLLWHEAPHRLAEALADLAGVFGADRPAAVARELTKRFEEVRRAPLGALAAHYAEHEALGEITLVVGPAPAEADASGLDDQLRTALRSHSVKDAAALVAGATGLPRKTVYARAIELGRDG